MHSPPKRRPRLRWRCMRQESPRRSSISLTLQSRPRWDGLIGTTQKMVGSLILRGETLLNTVSQINPIYFRCAIAEAEYLRLARRRAGKKISRDFDR
jgi:hypothetical protein